MIQGILWQIGAFANPLAEQAKAKGYTLKNAELHQKKVDYLTFLHIHDVLTDSQYDKALDRVFHKQIHKDMVKDGEGNEVD